MTKKVKRRECDRCPAAPEYLFGSFFENELLCWDCAEDEKGCPNYGKPEFKGKPGTKHDLAHLFGAMGNRRGL